jgi:MATE family multidrug resistance protein
VLQAAQQAGRTARFFIEARQILALALPIVGSQFASVLMGLLDTVMAGRAGADEQAVVGLGVAIWIPVFLALMGVVQAVSPLVAHRFGARDYAGIVHDTQQAMWLGLMLGIVPLLLLPQAPALLAVFDVPGPLADKTVLFLQGIAFGLPAALVFRALAFYSASINRPGVGMVLGFASLAINAVLNQGLIHGLWGLPKLGGAGCGWATGVGMWVGLVLIGIWISVSPHYAQCRVWEGLRRPHGPTLFKLLALGLPIGGANFAEVAAFTGVALFIGSMGAATIAGHQAALNFASLVFMLPAGLSAALAIRVGQSLGAGDGRAARFVSCSGLLVALGMALCLTPLIALGRHHIAAWYSPDPKVQAIAAWLLLFAAVWHVADALQVCAAGALRGYRITLGPMLMMVAAYWAVALPLGHHLAHVGWPSFGLQPMGVAGFWAGLLVGLFSVSAALLALLARVARRTTVRPV